MRKNQKGFTLVELIIAIAILAIVMLAVGGFMVVGSKSYTSANTDIMLQQEAQLALNQISDVIIDTTDSINYGNGTDTVLKDSEFGSEPDTKILVVVNRHDGKTPENSESQNKNPSYRFEWNKDDETIYFNTSNTAVDDANPAPVFADANRAILVQHVKELHIDISQFEENRVVMISMTLANGNKEYTTSNNVTVRNRIALNKIDVEPMKKAQDFAIETVKNVTLEPLDTYNLAAKTTVDTSSDDDAVIWELASGAAVSAGTGISPDGQLTIGKDEKNKSFEVRVRRANEEYTNQNNKVAQTIKVYVKRVNSVDLSCPTTTIKSGETVTVYGSAGGNLLGNSCDADSCLTDDESKDHDLISWRIVRGPTGTSIESSDTGKAEVKIPTSAKAGDEIEIEATSDLSARKSYGTVTGTLVLKVTEGTTGTKPFQQTFEYGTWYDTWLSSITKYGYDDYVVCARVREIGATDGANDQVILYHAKWGESLTFCPDIFGLDLGRDYSLFFQIINPPKGTADADITNEYLAGTDASGKYTGKYEASDFYGGILYKPYIKSTPINQTYSFYSDNGQKDVDQNKRPQCMFFKGLIDQTPINNIRPEVANSNAILKYAVYKEDKNNPDNWERLYGVDPTTGEYPDGGKYILPDGDIRINIPDGNLLEWYTWYYDHPIQNLPGACGTYHIVMGYAYKNDLSIFKGVPFYKHNVRNNFDIQYFEFPDCASTVKVDMGLNMELYPENGESRLSWFPLPTDDTFPFKAISGEQTEQKNFYVYSGTSGAKQEKWFANVLVKCKYESGSYKIEFTLGNSQYVYTCAAGGNHWNLQMK